MRGRVQLKGIGRGRKGGGKCSLKGLEGVEKEGEKCSLKCTRKNSHTSGERQR